MIACAFLLIAPLLQFTKQAKYKTDKIFRNSELVNILSGIIALAAVFGTVYLTCMSNVKYLDLALIPYFLVVLGVWMLVFSIYGDTGRNVLEGAPILCLSTGIIGTILMILVNPASVGYMLGVVILGILFLIWIRIIK